MADTFLRIDERAVGEVKAILEQFQQPKMDRLLQRAASSGAGALRVPIQRLTPVKARGGKVGEGYGTPGDLRDSVKVKRVRTVAGVASVVGPMGKKAFTRHWVIRGTKPHEIVARAQAAREGMSLRAAFGALSAGRRHTLEVPLNGSTIYRRRVRHPGARSNDYVVRAAMPHLGAVRERMTRTILRAAKKEGFTE